MSLNNPQTNLEDLIIIQRKVIPDDICNCIIGMTENETWETHEWYAKNTEEKLIEKDINIFNNSKNPSVCYSSEIIQNILNPYILAAKENYISKVSYDAHNGKFKVSSENSLVRINRYDSGQSMKEHCDHIRSLFTPPKTGIPILSMIIGLNSDYEGGELVFWNKTKFKILSGDIIIWPSLFLYPHQVYEVTKNKRYTGVCWFW